MPGFAPKGACADDLRAVTLGASCWADRRSRPRSAAAPMLQPPPLPRPLRIHAHPRAHAPPQLHPRKALGLISHDRSTSPLASASSLVRPSRRPTLALLFLPSVWFVMSLSLFGLSPWRYCCMFYDTASTSRRSTADGANVHLGAISVHSSSETDKPRRISCNCICGD